MAFKASIDNGGREVEGAEISAPRAVTSVCNAQSGRRAVERYQNHERVPKAFALSSLRLRISSSRVLVSKRKSLYKRARMPCTAVLKAEGTNVVPTGLDIIRLPLAEIVEWLLTASGLKQATHYTRDELIRMRHEAGERLF